jgi:hypothetical protein
MRFAIAYRGTRTAKWAQDQYDCAACEMRAWDAARAKVEVRVIERAYDRE